MTNIYNNNSNNRNNSNNNNNESDIGNDHAKKKKMRYNPVSIEPNFIKLSG